MVAKVILNPYAGRWLALKRKAEVEAALRSAGIEYELVITQGPGHGLELAKQAVLEGYSPIISAGGDGSVSEVVNGMVQAAQSSKDQDLPPLGILPLGSANDLVVNLGLPLDLAQAARAIVNGKIRRMDLGQVTLLPEGKSRFFDNNSAIGLEPSITLIQQRIKRLRGVTRYLVATLIGIAHNPLWTVYMEWEGGEYHGRANLVTVGNNPLTGGLFYMTPHADPFDGLLTIVYGYVPNRLNILRVLPMTMKPGAGNYVEHPAIHEFHSPWLRIRTEPATPVHADGEIQSENVQEVHYRILPGHLPVLMP